VDTTVLGLSKEEALEKPYIASMGVYVFKKEILLNLLRYKLLSVKILGFFLWLTSSINVFFKIQKYALKIS
jgi:glucose-1-phosphate adenylyltransferase